MPEGRFDTRNVFQSRDTEQKVQMCGMVLESWSKQL